MAFIKKLPISQASETKQCYFCTTSRHAVDYKDAESLRRFTSVTGKVYPRRKSSLCARHQRVVTQAIKRARYLALLTYTTRK